MNTALLPVNRRVNFVQVVRSEWIKALTVRSTPWTLAVCLAAIVGLSCLIAYAAAADTSQGLSNVVDILPVGPIVAQWAVAVIGALMITGEYSTGQVRSTFAAVTRRGQVLAAKAVVLTVLSTLVVTAGQLLAAPLVATILNHVGALRWDDVRLWQVMGAETLAFDSMALVALGLGFALRSTAATISATLGLGYGLAFVCGLIPAQWGQQIGAWSINNLSNAIAASPETIAADRAGGLVVVTPGQAAVALMVWVLVALTLGAWRLRRSDV